MTTEIDLISLMHPPKYGHEMAFLSSFFRILAVFCEFTPL